MSNPFYVNARTFVPGTLARGSDVDDDLDAIQTGFDLVETYLADAFRFTNADMTSAVFTENAGNRAWKSLAFDANGDPSLQPYPATLLADVQAAAAAAAASEAAAAASETAAGLSEAAAAASETAAGLSETAAAASEAAAALSESNAAASETAAGLSETNAGISESNANTYAGNAALARDAAIVARSGAEAAESAAAISEANAQTYSNQALTYRNTALTAASNASTSEANAATSESKAQQWATEAEDVQVETGLYSAYHWAQKAEDFALSGDVPAHAALTTTHGVTGDILGSGDSPTVTGSWTFDNATTTIANSTGDTYLYMGGKQSWVDIGGSGYALIGGAYYDGAGAYRYKTTGDGASLIESYFENSSGYLGFWAVGTGTADAEIFTWPTGFDIDASSDEITFWSPALFIDTVNVRGTTPEITFNSDEKTRILAKNASYGYDLGILGNCTFASTYKYKTTGQGATLISNTNSTSNANIGLWVAPTGTAGNNVNFNVGIDITESSGIELYGDALCYDALRVYGAVNCDGAVNFNPATVATFLGTGMVNDNYCTLYHNASGSADYGLTLKHIQGDTQTPDVTVSIGGDASREGELRVVGKVAVTNGTAASTFTGPLQVGTVDGSYGLEIGTHTVTTETDLAFNANCIMSTSQSMSFGSEMTFGAAVGDVFKWYIDVTSRLTGSGGGTLAAAIDDSGIFRANFLRSEGIADLNGGIDLEGEVREQNYTISGTAVSLDPNNGTLQKHTLTGNTTYSIAAGFGDGESMTLHVDQVAANYSVTWPSAPTLYWIGNSAPDLSDDGEHVISLWKVGTYVVAAYIGVFA